MALGRATNTDNGCVALLYTSDFYTSKCKNSKCKFFFMDFLDELGYFKQKIFCTISVKFFSLLVSGKATQP